MKRLMTVLIGGLLAASIQAADLPIAPFEADYQVYAKGMNLGQGTIRLVDEGAGRYAMTASVEASGIAKLLADDIQERALGTVNGDGVQPMLYERQDKDGLSRLAFNWQAGTVDSLHEQERETLPLEAAVLDRLSIYLQVMGDLKQGERQTAYTMADKNRLRIYQLSYDGTEVVDTPLGPLETLMVSRRRDGSDTVLHLWLAPSLDYLPVQITQREDGKEKALMRLDKLRRG